MRGEIDLAAWYMVADGARVTSGNVPTLLSRIAALRATLDGLLPQATLDVSPEEPLRTYRQATARLTLLLYAFGIPIAGLVLYFVTLVVGMAARRQQGEAVVLRSRGTTRVQVVGLYLLQWSLLGLVALALGWPLGRTAATLMTRTRSFLSFTSPLFSPPSPLTWTDLRFGFVAVALSILAAIIPALAASRHTIVTHQQELMRALRRPWWQRYFLDLMLLVPAIYGYVLLRRPTSSPSSLLSPLTQGDLFANPIPCFSLRQYCLSLPGLCSCSVSSPG